MVVFPAKDPLWHTFKFDQFSVKSLLVQAVEHVAEDSRFEPITPETLARMSHELNELIGIAVQPYDSPPSYPWDFDFKFDSVRDPHVIMRVIDNKKNEIVLEWEN